MSNYDHDVIGIGNSSHPANQELLPKEPEQLSPLEMENEELYEENCKLKDKLELIKSLLEPHKEHSGVALLILNNEKLWTI